MSGEHRKLTRDTLALYVSHFFKVVLPLITIPFLARVLGVEGMGMLAFVQAYSMFVLQALEFGFSLSQTREVARFSDSVDRLATITSGVLGAQVVMALVVLLVSLGLTAWVNAFRADPRLLWFGVASGLLQGMNFSWLLRGLQWMRWVALLEILFRIVRTVIIFLFIRRPEDVWIVTAADAVAALLMTSIATVLVFRHLPFQWPDGPKVARIWRESWNLFLVRVGATFFAAGNVLVMGLFVPPTLVGYYNGAEKITNALRMLFNPLVDALYPKMSREAVLTPARAYRSAKRIFFGLLVLGCGMSGGLFVLAPWMVRWLLGPEFEASVGVLRIFALFPPLAAVNLGLGNLWLLARGHQNLFVVTGLATGSLSLVLTFGVSILAASQAHHGAAIAFLVSQLAMAAIFARRTLDTGRRALDEEKQAV